MPTVNQLQDLINLTRTTELQKGSWLSLVSKLSGYPLVQSLLPRATKRTSHQIQWTLTRDPNPNDTAEYVGVGDPVQTSAPQLSRRATVNMVKLRRATTFARDEQELQGTAEEELADIVTMRIAEKLNQPLLDFQEEKLAGAPANGDDDELYGLRYWFPSDLTAGKLELNGGGNPAGFAGGAAGVTVADVPRWAHAVSTFDQVADDDLLDTLHEFRIRVNYHVPDGVRSLVSDSPSRVILTNHPVYLTFARLQTTANENLRTDLGLYRGEVTFMSTPVRFLPVISTPGQPETPTDRGLLYDLDLNTLQLVVHSGYDFSLQQMDKADTPGVVLAYREGYEQLVCKSRERNLVAATDNVELIAD
jgi:hypothetical protein